MKNYIVAAAILSVSLLGAAAKAADKTAEYVTVVMEWPLKVSADEAWKRFWPFCEVHNQMDRAGMPGHKCTNEKGNGTDVGDIRHFGEAHETMIEKGKYSYTYATSGPNPTDYHSNFEVVPEGPNKSKFVRRWYWLPKKGTAEADAAELDRYLKIFADVFNLQVKIAQGAKP